MASSVVTLQRYVRGWIARKTVETVKNKQNAQQRVNEAAKKKMLREIEMKNEANKENDITVNQIDEFGKNNRDDIPTPWGNVKMKRKLFSQAEDKDEAATVIQSRK